MTLRVGVNLLWLVPGVVGGSEEYTVRLLAGVAEAAPPDIELVLFTLRQFGEVYPDLVDAFPTRSRADQGSLQSGAGRGRGVVAGVAGPAPHVDLVHHAGGTMPLVRTRPGILTIHDLQPLVMPEHFSATKQLWLRRRLPPSARHARLVMTLTEDTRRSVIDRLGARPERVTIVPAGIGLAPEPTEDDAADDPADAYGIDGPFFLYPAITYPHKNHVLLVRAFALVLASGPTPCSCSPAARPSEDELLEAIDTLGVGHGVRRLGRIPRPDLEWLFRRAVALTFPSRFEGFGLPVLEAMADGLPGHRRRRDRAARGRRRRRHPLARRRPRAVGRAMLELLASPDAPGRSRHRRPGPRRGFQLGGGDWQAAGRLPPRVGNGRVTRAMNLLVICPHFAPDVAPTGEVMTSIARSWSSGATASTSSPRCRGTSTTASSRGGRASSCATRTRRGAAITRVHPFPTDKTNIPRPAARLRRLHRARRSRRRCARGPSRTPCWPCRRRSPWAWPGGSRPASAGRRSSSTSRTSSPTSPSSSGCSRTRG